MDWLLLSEENQLVEIYERSFEPDIKGIILFKHSTRCGISSMAKSRLERYGNFDAPVYYLDLLSYRNLSDKIAGQYDVEHQSPQVIIIKNGKCVYTASHSEIDFASIQTFLNS
ncbi:MAG: bacillithiol system protein YtxJ [Bacteroidetes bacterium]|nr:bacillithiol system protein YtxJ [Bacteroidota bacterium]